ncbi:MAG: hypothetical protein JWM12_3097 [Ilumatobacteraceae bacterium]|nr:hypothetical protein [Ilumatobacteraceae bacterium]
MAFGQSSGPPATAKQIQELLSLLQDAGHSDFRDARGPMGFTQRQAGGKFSREEADAFIEQLQESASDAPDAASSTSSASTSGGGGGATRPPARAAARPTATERAMQQIPTPQLAAELQRRGWIVIEP